MPIDLSSARFKLARAEEHARAINDELVIWFKENPCSVVADVNADHTRWAFRAVIPEGDREFRRVSILVGDCLNNARSALDHAMYAVVRHDHCGKGSVDDIHNLAFPIADDLVRYADLMDRMRKLKKRISAFTYDILESLQPYHRPTEVDPSRGALTVLRDMNNIDKHRLLHVGRPERGALRVRIVENPDGAKPSYSDPPGAIEDGTEFMVITFDVPAPNMKYKLEMPLGVAIEHRGVPFNLPSGLTDLVIPEVAHALNTIEAAF